MIPTSLPLIPQSEWNRVVDSIQRAQVNTLGIEDPRGARNPWNVRARWNFELERIEFNLRSGYVNAGQVKAPAMDYREAPARTVERIGLDNIPKSEKVEPWLSERPWFPVSEGTIGPRVVTREPLDAQAMLAQFALDPASEAWEKRPRERRQLRAVHIVLLVPRPAARTVLSEDQLGIAADISAPAPGGVRITARREYFPAPPAPTLAEQLSTGRTDTNLEQRKVATIYFVSPPGVLDPSAPLNAAWLVFPNHFFFYNKAFTAKVSARLIQPLNLGLNVPLAGGVAQPTIDAIFADVNRVDEAAVLTLSQVGVEAEFWDV